MLFYFLRTLAKFGCKNPLFSKQHVWKFVTHIGADHQSEDWKCYRSSHGSSRKHNIEALKSAQDFLLQRLVFYLGERQFHGLTVVIASERIS